MIHNLLPRDQHGFRASYSTTTALGVIFHRLNSMPKTEQPVFLSLDIKKAFDSLPHPIIDRKMSSFCEPNIGMYFNDEYIHRNSYVCYKGVNSEAIAGVGAGVTQGGCNSPTEFILPLDEYPNIYRFRPYTNVNLFADDAGITTTGGTVGVSDEALVANVRRIFDESAEYMQKIGLQMSRTKTGFLIVGQYKFVNMGTAREPVISKRQLKHLGLEFSCDLFNKGAFEPEIKRRVQKLEIIRDTCSNIGDLGYVKWRKLAAFQKVYGTIQYGMEVMPILTDPEYNTLNKHISGIIMDVWNLQRFTHKKQSYAYMFGQAKWLTSKRTQFYLIAGFANRILLTKKPYELYKQIMELLVYDDGTPFKNHESNMQHERETAEYKYFLGHYPVYQSSKTSVRSKAFFPFNLAKVLPSIPIHIRTHFGRANFNKLYRQYLLRQCQHRDGKTDCKFCLKTNMFQVVPETLKTEWNDLYMTGYGYDIARAKEQQDQFERFSHEITSLYTRNENERNFEHIQDAIKDATDAHYKQDAYKLPVSNKTNAYHDDNNPALQIYAREREQTYSDHFSKSVYRYYTQYQGIQEPKLD